MLETTVKVTSALGVASPILPAPVATTVTVVNVAATACLTIGALFDEADGWGWPWKS